MYREIGEFIRNVGGDNRLWLDGEFWTALAIGIGGGIWFHVDPTRVIDVRSHFGDLLSITSIVFGFVLATLFFYIQTAGAWSNDDDVGEVAELLVDHHVWAVVSHLVLIGYTLFLWVCGRPDWWTQWVVTLAYSLLTFLVAYCGLQILNQVLTVRWAFRRRHRLLGTHTPDGGSDRSRKRMQDNVDP